MEDTTSLALRGKFAKANIAASRVVLNKYFLIHAFSLSRFATAPSRREPEFEGLLDKPRPRGEVAAQADGEGILSPTHTTPLCEDYSSTTSWSPFPDKGRLNVTRFVVLCIFICLYTIINKSLNVETIPTSLPLSWEHSASLRIKFAVGKH